MNKHHVNSDLIPQVDSLRVLRELIEALDGGARTHMEICRLTGLDKQQRYYVLAGMALGWITT